MPAGMRNRQQVCSVFGNKTTVKSVTTVWPEFRSIFGQLDWTLIRIPPAALNRVPRELVKVNGHFFAK